MSDTPRTDAAEVPCEVVHQDAHSDGWIETEFARQLERELADAEKRLNDSHAKALVIADKLAEARAELQDLRQWKASAEQVLNEWSAVWEWAGKPGKLGHSQASGVRGEIERLRAAVGLAWREGFDSGSVKSQAGYACNNSRAKRIAEGGQ